MTEILCFECGQPNAVMYRMNIEYTRPDGSVLRRSSWPVCGSCIAITTEHWDSRLPQAGASVTIEPPKEMSE